MPKESYAKAGDATALLQQHPEAPENPALLYKCMQSEKGEVICMLEVIQSYNARLEAENADQKFLGDLTAT